MIICADDFGISPAVNTGILELASAKRISSISCMMIGPSVEHAMAELRLFEKRFDAGLHLVLTNDPPLTNLSTDSGLTDPQGNLLSFGKLMKNAFLKKIDNVALKKEISAQLDRFMTLSGHPPDYIDGHQHIQQLPIIRDAIVEVAQELLKNNPNTYIRVAQLPRKWLMTTGVSRLGRFFLGNFFIMYPGKSMIRLMAQNNIPHNRFLLGYYDYMISNKFADIFHWYLTLHPKENDIFFCHPGYVDQELRNRDSVVDSRIDVLEFLKSNDCMEMMRREDVKINTFSSSSDLRAA